MFSQSCLLDTEKSTLVCCSAPNEPCVFVVIEVMPAAGFKNSFGISPSLLTPPATASFIKTSSTTFPGEGVHTTRYQLITIEADNWEEKCVLGPMSDDKEEAADELWESISAQHEIDHLNGITMFDRRYKQEPIKRGVNAPIKIGRNTKIEIKKGDETKTIKWKKAEPMLSEGWSVVEESIQNV